MSVRLDYVNVDFIDSVMAENTRLKELNREMVELIKFFEMDIDDVLAGRVTMINWSKRLTKVKEILIKAEGRGEGE